MVEDTHNKRMQTDLTKRYALASAADAGRIGGHSAPVATAL